MALNRDTVIAILELKHKDENLRLSRVGRKAKKGEVLLSNCAIAEMILGNRKAESTVRRIWAEYKKKGNYRGIVVEGGLAGGSLEDSKVFRKKATGKRFVLTSVQNNTLLHEEFFNTLLNYCKHNDAELMVSGFYYNRNGFQNGQREGAWFDDRVVPFMGNDSVELSKGLVWSAELNILPTAQQPISGFHNYNNDASFIIPHAKLCLESVPTPKMDKARLIYTTGCISLRNYKQMKAGQIADHHHSFSALVDEDGDWFVRQLNCESKTGNFYDLDKYYTPNSVEEGCTIEAVNYGDLHVSGISPKAVHACWSKANPNNILDTLKPKYQFLHDTNSNDYRNHHEIKNPLYMFKQFSKKQESVKEELLLTTKVIAQLDRPFSQRICVDSNHDRSLQRFLIEQDFKKDPVNAVFMLEMTLAMYKAVEEGKPFHTYEHACRSVNSNMETVRFLRMDEDFKICGDIIMSSHGDLGSNGARPSIMSFKKLGQRITIGHQHQTSISQGVYCAGSCMATEDASYTKGASSWSISHVLTYSNGKRTVITQKGSKWRV